MSIIQGLWVENDLSRIERLSVKSFLDHGHRVHVYTYATEPLGLPDGALQLDGRDILPQDQLWRYQTGVEKGSWAGISDLFRYLLLNARGGTWTDLDVICLRPLPDDTHIIPAQRLLNGALETGNQILRLPPSDPLLSDAIAACRATDPANISFGEIGPKLLQHLFRHHGYESLVKPVTFANPLPGNVFEEAFLPEYGDWYDKLTHATDSYGVHLWNEKSRRLGYPKDAALDHSCLVERLMARHGLPLSKGTPDAGLRARLFALKARRTGVPDDPAKQMALVAKSLAADLSCANARGFAGKLARRQPALVLDWLATGPATDTALNLALHRGFLAANLTQESAAALTRAAQHFDDNAAPTANNLALKADLLLAQGRPRQALEAAVQACEMEETPNALLKRASAELALELHKDALHSAKRLLDINPGDKQALNLYQRLSRM